MKENNKLRNARERMGLFKQLLALIEEYINNPEFVSVGASLGISACTCKRLAKRSITHGKTYKKDNLYWKAEEGGTE